MKNVLVAAVVVGLLALAPPFAHAGEKYIGRILASDAGTANNFNTGYLTAGCAPIQQGQGGNCDQAFNIPTNAKLSIQCDEASLLAVNNCYTDAGTAVAWPAATLFPTSTGSAVRCPALGSRTDDGGVFNGGVLAIAPAVGASSVRCRVYERSGTE